MTLKHLVVLKIKEIYNKKRSANKSKGNVLHSDGSISKKHTSRLKELPMAKTGTSWMTKVHGF
jgi:hypothetical protein